MRAKILVVLALALAITCVAQAMPDRSSWGRALAPAALAYMHVDGAASACASATEPGAVADLRAYGLPHVGPDMLATYRVHTAGSSVTVWVDHFAFAWGHDPSYYDHVSCWVTGSTDANASVRSITDYGVYLD
jgi:hypothetical protein